ncbi:MAG: sigma-70 family RNA polymerase sigma factor, partial [Alkalinema sp. RU_4_3]|nr:sigma-70 family RNA polymerase sigma factor [Alkalinema sp. RU_4_3]
MPVVVRSAQTPIRSDYLFALVWRHIFNELGGLDIGRFAKENLTFQGWLLQTTAAYINQVTLPPVEDIHYDIRAASPPYWCYLDRALDELPPDLRLMIVMAQTYNWSET